MFAGCLTQRPKIQEAFQRLADQAEGLANIPYDNRGSWTKGDVGLFQQRIWNTAESRDEDGVITHEESQTRICAWARIDNREELINKLPVDLHTLAASDTGVILAAYLHWGDALCEHLIGDFAFAIYDGREDRFILGRDHTGVRPLYYFWNGKDFAFATSLAILDGVEALDLQLSEEWLARYLLACSEDWSVTSFEKVYKVPPAHVVTFDGSEPREKRYFEFSAEATLHLGSDEEYVEIYRQVLKEAVACRVRSDYPIGSESSGGLDSATTTCLASEFMQNPSRDLHTYAYVFYDQEPECIQSVSDMWPMRPTYLLTEEGPLQNEELWPRYWQANGCPSEHGDGYYHHPFYEQAENSGARTLLSGFGGDEFVTNSGGLARVEFLRSGQYALLASRSPGNLLTSNLRALKWAAKFYRSKNTFPTAQCLIQLGQEKWHNRIVADRFVSDRFRHLATDSWRYDGGCLTQNEFALNNRWSPGMTARLENCTLMAASYGVEYRWPLMDIRLLKLFLSIPAEQKLGPKGIGRWLHRRAVADIIPSHIAWRDKGMGDPIVDERKPAKPADDIPTSIDLSDSPLEQIVDAGRLKSLIARLPQLSEEEWIEQEAFDRLTSLDRWLKSRERGYQNSA